MKKQLILLLILLINLTPLKADVNPSNLTVKQARDTQATYSIALTNPYSYPINISITTPYSWIKPSSSFEIIDFRSLFIGLFL